MGTSIIVLSINKSTYLSWFKQKDLFNNYSLKAKWILFNNPCDKGKGLFNNIHDIYFVVKTFLLQLFWLLI